MRHHSPTTRRSDRPRHGLVHRAVALLLSWIFVASTVWAAAPPPVAPPSPDDKEKRSRFGAVAGLAERLRKSARNTESPQASPPEDAEALHSKWTRDRDDDDEDDDDRNDKWKRWPHHRWPKPRNPIRPQVECVEDRGDGRWVAHFGYESENSRPVFIHYGEDNRFSPPPERRGQPVKFFSGKPFFWPRTAFRVPFDGEPVTWHLRGPDDVLRSATASMDSPRCGAPPPPVCETVFWGPRRFTRTWGRPNVYEETITVPLSVGTPHVLHVKNGREDGRRRVRFARIEINGEQVAGPRDFGWKVEGFQKTVDLTPESQLEVTLASLPGSYITLSFCGGQGDATPPVVEWTEPAHGSAIGDATPRLALVYDDPTAPGEPGASGVDPDTLVVTLDGEDRTDLFTARDQDASAELPDALALDEGFHTLVARVQDRAGNAAQATSEFRVDLHAPTLAVTSPPAGIYLRPPATITVAYGDETELDPTSLRIFVNGVDRTPLFTTGPDQATATLGVSEGLVEGPNQIEARINDRAGNESAAGLAFSVDTIPPTLVISQPSQGSRHGSPDVEVTLQFQDDQALDVSSLAAEVNGTPVPLTPVPGGANGWLGPLPDGTHTLVVRIQDLAGNQAQAESTFTVDTAVPTIQVAQPIPGTVLATGAPSFLVTYSDGEGVDTSTLRILVDGVDQTSLFTVEPDVAYADWPPGPVLADGDHTVSAEIQDLTGNTGQVTTSFGVDTLPPTVQLDAPPPLTGESPTAVTLRWNDAVAGVDPASAVILVDGEDRTGLFAVDASGATGVLDVDPPLADGAHEIAVQVADHAGNGADTTFSFTLDTTPPSLVVAAPVADSFINEPLPEMRVTWSDLTAGADTSTLRVFLQAGTDPEVEITARFAVAGDEATAETPPAEPLADGTWRLRAVLNDLAGNGAAAQVAFVVDTVAPTFTIEQPASGVIVGTAAPAFDILYADDASGIDLPRLTLAVDGIDRTDRLVWEADRATGALLPQDGLEDGEHGVEVGIYDKAGNAAPMPPHTFIVDTVAPTAAVESPIDGMYLGTSTPTVRVVFQDQGTAPTGIEPSSVVVEVDGVDRTADLTVTDSAAEGVLQTALADGPHTVVVRVADLAGHPATGMASFVVDTQPPSVSNLSLGEGDYVAQVDAQGNLTITGQFQDMDPQTTLRCRVGSSEVDATVNGNDFTCSVPVEEGAAAIEFIATDRSGNTATTTRNINVDLTAPTVTILDPADGSYTNATVLNVSGTVVDTSPVQVDVQGVAAGVNGQAFVATGIPAGADPQITLRAVATDAAGNTSSHEVVVTIDRVAPVIDITYPENGDAVQGPSVNVEGTFSDDSPVSLVYVNGQEAVLAGGGTGSGTFSAGIPAPDGPLAIEARGFDAAGNEGTDRVDAAVDSVPPSLNLTEPAPGTVTNDSAIRVAGTVTDTTTVTLTVDGQPVAVDPSGGFGYDRPLGGDGTETITLVATDGAGNVASLSVDVVVDRTAPDLQVVAPGEGDAVGALPVVVQGTVDDATATTVTVDGVAATIVGLGWSADIDSLSDGPHTFDVVATDAAGNTTSVQRMVTLDLAPPEVTITAPPSGSFTADGTVSVSGTVLSRTPSTVTVNGVSAVVTGDTFVADSVPLAEGDNTLTAVAINVVNGRTDEDSVLVTRDSVPPVVTLTVPETISRDRPGRAVVTAIDAIGVASVEIFMNGGSLGQFTTPPFEADLVVPPGVQAGDTLTITASAIDRAGNAASVDRGVRVTTAGVVVGQVLDDTTSLPLEGVSVRIVSGAGGEEIFTDEVGRFALAAEDERVVLTAQAPGFTSADRHAAIASGVGNVVVDARLQTLADPVSVGAGGGTIGADPMQLTVPPGAVAVDTGFQLTALSGQGLPGLLPLGFSPVAALDLRTSPVTPLLVPVDLDLTGLPDTLLHLVAYRFSTHGWYVVERDLTPSGGALIVALPQTGAYALVAADGGAQAVAVPDSGQDLVGVDMVALPDDAGSDGQVVPAVLPPSGGTASGRLVVQATIPLPSGTVVQAEITETYSLASGDVASEETRRQDILVYRQRTARDEAASPTTCLPGAPEEGELCAVFPITPKRSYAAVELLEGTVHLDILAGREGVRGKAGGIDPVTLESEDVAISVAGGSLASDTAVSVEATELSSFIPAAPGVTALREAVVDLTGAQLSIDAELSMDAAVVPAGGALVVARVERLAGVPHLVVVALARRAGTRVVSQAFPGLAGIREGGRYVFLRVEDPLGFVAGTASTISGPAAARVGTEDLPFVDLAGPDGAFIVAAKAGPGIGVEATLRGTSLAASQTADVADGVTTPLDLLLVGTATLATVTPEDGAVAQPVGVQVEIASPVALDPATVSPTNIEILDAGVPVAVRFILSATGQRLAVVPEDSLAFSTTYTVRASGLLDTSGVPVDVPDTTFTTKDDIPPVYDLRALSFSIPDDGLAQASAPPGSLPPFSKVLIINSGNGVVITFEADDTGAVTGEFPATTDDQLLITITDPLGNVTSFTKSEWQLPDGSTAIGAGGGIVEGEGGVEIRIPEGAVEEGVALRVELVDPASIPPNEIPDFGTDGSGQPLGQIGAAFGIRSSEQPEFKKEIDLVFPVPDGATEDAFFYVYRRLEGPGGKIGFETLDHAFIEGSGDDARVVSASPPFRGYVDSVGGYDLGGAVAKHDYNLTLLMWHYDALQPGKALTSVITGKVLRVVWDPGAVSPTFEPVPAGTIVVGADEQGNPLIDKEGAHLTRTSGDGTYVLNDPRNIGGTTIVAANVDGVWRIATVYELPVTDRDPGLRFYRNVFTANITFPAAPPPAPPPAIDIFVMEEFGDQRRLVPNGLALQGQPLVIGMRVSEGDLVEDATIEGFSYAVREDTWPDDQPLAMDYLIDTEFNPDSPGTVTVTATALPAFGPPVTVAQSFRVLAAGGEIDNLPNDPPAVIGGATVPSDGAEAVPPSVFPQIAFTEPVRNVLDNIRLVDDSNNSDVEVVLSGVGLDAGGVPTIWDPVPDNNAVVTSVTIQPRGGLKYGTPYRLFVEGGAGGVEDLDRTPFDEPAPKTLEPTPYVTDFTTYSPELLTPPGTGEVFGSPSIVRLGETVYLAENFFVNGVLRAFDVENPVFPQPIDLEGETLITNRPVDIAAEGNTVVVASGPTNQSKPSNVYLFDVTDVPPNVSWVGAAGLTNGVNDGFVFRVTVKDGLAYAATFKKGIQVVDLSKARLNFEEAVGDEPFSAGYWDMIQALNTDGRQFGGDAVVITVPVRTSTGQPARLYDLKTMQAVLEGQSQPLVVATGDVGIVLVNPQAGAVMVQGEPESSDGLSKLSTGSALDVAPVDDRVVAVLAGYGLTGADPPESGYVLAVVDVTDPTTPTARGFVELPEAPQDVAIHGNLALVASAGRTHLVNLTDLDLPILAGGPIEGIAGRLAVAADSNVVFSSARSVFGGSDPLGGVRSAVLNPGEVGACPLLTLKDRRVVLELTLDQVNETLCGQPRPVRFGLCEAATVTFEVDGRPLMASIDGSAVQELTDIALPAGPHVVSMPAGVLGGVYATTKPFTAEARSIADPALVQEEEGTVEADIKNRSVLPVGHTFVKNVDIFDGHVVHQATDLDIPGRHLGLSVVRSYSSAAKGASGPMGAGWSFNYSSGVYPSSCGVYVVVTPDGGSQSFQTTDGGLTFSPQKGYHTTLIRNDDESYDFIDKAGVRYHFRDPVDPDEPDGARRLLYVEEPHGDQIRVFYDTNDRVERVVERHVNGSEPRRLHVTWTNKGGFDRIESIETDSALAIRIEYEYDDWGNLIRARRAGTNVPGQPSGRTRVERYDYSVDDARDRHQLIRTTDPNGAVVEYEYYTDSDSFPGFTADSWFAGLYTWAKEEYAKQVREYPGDTTVTTDFAYDYSGASTGSFVTTVTDPRRNDTRYTMNSHGGPTLIEEPLGRATRYTWATDDIYRTVAIDPLNQTTTFDYDERGNLIRETIETAEFGNVTTEWRYDPLYNKLTYQKDAEGRETFHAIDPVSGDLISTRDAVGNETVYNYDDEGQLETVLSPRGFTTRHENHDSFGNAQSVTDPLGNVTTAVWDSRGRLLSTTSTMGHREKVEYDAFDRAANRTRVVCASPCAAPQGIPESEDAATRSVFYPGGQPRTLTNPNGATVAYELDGMNRVTATRTQLPRGETYETTTRYDGNGNKVSEIDRRGVERVFTYDEIDRLTKIEISSGSPGGGPYGQIAAYTHDLVGNQRSVTDLYFQTTEYVYDDLYRVKTKILPEEGSSGRYQESYTYDRVGNRLSLTDANGNTTEWAYDGVDRLILTRNALGQEQTVAFEDPEGSRVNKREEHDAVRGLRTTFSYDPLNRESRREVHLEGAGGKGVVDVTSTQYDDAAHTTLVTDPEAHETLVYLDGLDRPMIVVRDAAGLALETRLSYDGLGNRKARRDPRGFVTRRQFDGLGREVEYIDALGRLSESRYDGEGLKEAETDRRGVRTTFSYDSLGRLVRETLVPSITGVPWQREIEYEDQDLRRVERDGKGNETTFQLDRLGRVVEERDPRGNSIVTVWDGVNRREVVDKRGQPTAYEYDALNRVRLVTDALGQEVLTTYEDAENATTEEDRRGIVTRTESDPLGRLVRVLRPWEAVSRTGTALETVEWDGNSNRTAQTDAEGSRTEFVFDGANRLVLRTDGTGTAAASSIEYRYDANGNTIREIDERHSEESPTLRNGYDALNRLVSTTDGEGAVTLFDYDPEGNRVSIVEPEGHQTTFSYGEQGELLTVVQAAPSPGEASPITSYDHDRNRNRIRQTDANGHIVEMGYDELDRLTSAVQDAVPGGLNLLTIREYDENGNQTLVTDPKGQTIGSAWDALNRLESRSYALAPGETATPWRQTVGTVYEYDENSNVSRIDEFVASGLDPPDTTLTTVRTWDTQDRLESETTTLPTSSGVRTVSYEYFDNGNRKSVTDPSGVRTAYAYDGKNRLATATSQAGTADAKTTSYTYFADDLLQTVSYPNGVEAAYTYDGANRVTGVLNSAVGGPVSAYEYRYDRNGNRLAQLETNGGAAETTEYAYDRLNRLTEIQYPADSIFQSGRTIAYEYDRVGNRVRETTTEPGGSGPISDRVGVFDSLNRLNELRDQLDPSASEAFSWDANGNQVGREAGSGPGSVATAFIYDVRDKLVEVQRGASILARFQYDDEGRRNLKIGAAGIRQLVYDDTSLFLEYDTLGSQVAKYDYGSDRLVALTHVSEGRRYFSLDGLRSVVNLTDEAGTAVARYHLDTWGAFRFPDEVTASQNAFAFTGHVYDVETSLYNAKARYFDPGLGRFITQDSYLGQIDAPPSLHRYLYAHANPTFFTDPTGHYSWAEFKSDAKWAKDFVVAFGTDLVQNAPARALKVNDAINENAVGLVRETGANILDAGVLSFELATGVDTGYELRSSVAQMTGERIASGDPMAHLDVTQEVAGDTALNLVTFGIYGTAKEQIGALRDYSQGNATIEEVEDRLAGAAGGSVVNLALTAGFLKATTGSARGPNLVTKARSVVEGATQLTAKARGFAQQGVARVQQALRGNRAGAPQGSVGAARLNDPVFSVHIDRVTGEISSVAGRQVGPYSKVGSHHIIQNTAVESIQIQGFKPVTRGTAPAIDLGKSLKRGTPHHATRAAQRRPGGGTYGAERRIAYRALREAGFSADDARALIEDVADPYFEARGFTRDTPTRIPGDRR